MVSAVKINAIIVLIPQTNKMANSVLEKFDFLIENQFPEIKEFIKTKSEHNVIIEIPYNTGATWKKLTEICEPIFSYPTIFPVKKSSTMFNEKYLYFTINLTLEILN